MKRRKRLLGVGTFGVNAAIIPGVFHGGIWIFSNIVDSYSGYISFRFVVLKEKLLWRVMLLVLVFSTDVGVIADFSPPPPSWMSVHKARL